MSLILPVLAIVISVVSLSWSVRTSLRQREVSAIIANGTSLSQVESTLGNIPGALRFHGIDPHDLEDIGISPKEFAYLVSNFTLGGVYYRSTSKTRYRIAPGTYRYQMCQSDMTRRAWPTLRRMLSPGSYRDALDQAFALLDQTYPLQQNQPVE